MTTTVNISLPKNLYVDAQKAANEKGYTSISELFRDALRRLLYPEITENDFTAEFEEEILRREQNYDERIYAWNGKGSFVDAVLKSTPKNGKN